MDDFLPKRICLTCVNAIRSAYCFKVQSERSYKTLKEQFGSGYTNIKIEHCDHVPEHSIDQEQPDQMEIVSFCHQLRKNLNSKFVSFL